MSTEEFKRDEQYERHLRDDPRGYIVSKAGLTYLLAALDAARADAVRWENYASEVLVRAGLVSALAEHEQAKLRTALDAARAEADQHLEAAEHWRGVAEIFEQPQQFGRELWLACFLIGAGGGTALRMELSESKAALAAAHERGRRLRPYLTHHTGCGYRAQRDCDCGLKAAFATDRPAPGVPCRCGHAEVAHGGHTIRRGDLPTTHCSRCDCNAYRPTALATDRPAPGNNGK